MRSPKFCSDIPGSINATDIADLVNGPYAINVLDPGRRVRPQLLCSLVGFRRGDRDFAMVYLYKRGFYPPIPLPRSRNHTGRDNILDDLNVEQDLTCWPTTLGRRSAIGPVAHPVVPVNWRA